MKEQADNLMKNYNIHIEHFLIQKGGVMGYLKAVLQLKEYLNKNRVDIIHVHYGLWAFIAVLSKILTLHNYKIVITFHGSDINKSSERKIGLLASRFASHNILVSPKMAKYFRKKSTVIPCGIDTDVDLCFRDATRKKYGWSEDDFVILFSSSFSRKVKDPEFAFRIVEAFSTTTTRPVKFIELKGYSRNELTCLMQAADVLLLCSVSEGSPQVIKESILNSLPVLSNNVGDVDLICEGTDNCFIIDKKIEKYIECLKVLSSSKARVMNRDHVIMNFNNNLISQKIYSIYTQVLSYIVL
ncbi:glycosyltransferase family 4 protein [Pontibacter ruber]|uniref:Glycosyltransferase family 4 protein n=1 Tax=Pontibacter ruber TaxID=1343895 RepID=A0ABW5D397_9BACT